MSAPEPALPARPPGLSIERTALAWQRTALSLLGVSVLVARLALEALGPVVVLVVLLSLGHVLALFRSTRQRQKARSGLSTSRRTPTAVGLHGALLALQILLLAGIEVLSLVTARPT